MEAEDMIELPASSDVESDKNEAHNLNSDVTQTESELMNPEIKVEEVDIKDNGEGDVRNEGSQVILSVESETVLVGDPSTTLDGKVLVETFPLDKKLNSFRSEVLSENGGLPAQGAGSISESQIHDSHITGVKRARMTLDEQQPSVHITYSSLTRDSKRKLEELLQQWSAWHTKHCSSPLDPNEVLSGEDTYFPALHVGLESSAVSFWMDNQTTRQHHTELSLGNDHSVPLYDRAYASALASGDASNILQGSLDIVDSSRCFNCGSYNHALKECPKPRDNAAVNNARKQHKTRRNQSAGSRNPTRYYQNSAGGKYDGLRPGVLSAETCKLLGLGELDPPPWLDRMREMGYPPGYLDPDDEDQPSGITIFGDEEIGDEETKVETEDGEILETDYPEPPKVSELPKKMSVEFPGLNAPIPENADERRWVIGASGSEPYRSRSHRRVSQSSESSREYSRENRQSRDFRDDGPPGVSPLSFSYPPRYGGYDDSFQSPRSDIRIPRSPSFGRSMSDRGRISPLAHDDSSSRVSYHSLHYSSANAMPPTQSYGSASLGNNSDDRRGRSNFPSNFSSHGRDKQDGYHHHRR